MTVKKRGLAKGRGLDALLGSIQKEKLQMEAQGIDHGQLKQIDVNLLKRGEYQPRRYINEQDLQELAASIEKHRIMQPIVIRPVDDERYPYEIIAGERRWRAAKLAGLKEVPVIIKNYTEQEIVEIALIENIQREDLNPIEEAQAYKKLLTEFNLKQDEVAERVSKSRAAVTNSLADILHRFGHGDTRLLADTEEAIDRSSAGEDYGCMCQDLYALPHKLFEAS